LDCFTWLAAQVLALDLADGGHGWAFLLQSEFHFGYKSKIKVNQPPSGYPAAVSD
jgi:hypothetical protein